MEAVFTHCQLCAMREHIGDISNPIGNIAASVVFFLLHFFCQRVLKITTLHAQLCMVRIGMESPSMSSTCVT